MRESVGKISETFERKQLFLGTNFSKLLLGEMTILALNGGGGGYIFGVAFAWGTSDSSSTFLFW